MYLKELVSYEDCKCGTTEYDSEKYRDWLAQVEDGLVVVLADIGYKADDYDEWYDNNIDNIYSRLYGNDIITISKADSDNDESVDIDDILGELFIELNDI